MSENRCGTVWLADTKYMPCIAKDDVSRKGFYIIFIIDEQPRLVMAGLFRSNTVSNYAEVLETAVRKYGAPQSLYVDSGIVSRSRQLSCLCEELGIELKPIGLLEHHQKIMLEKYCRSIDREISNSRTVRSIQMGGERKKNAVTYCAADGR